MGCKPKRQFAGDIFDSCRPVIFNLYNLDSISITGGAFYLAVEKGSSRRNYLWRHSHFPFIFLYT